MAKHFPLADIIKNHRHHDEDQWFIEAVASAWYEDYIARGKDELDFALPDSRWRASWAGSCARKIAYHAAGIEPSDPPTAADSYRFNTGSLVHEDIQRIVTKLWPDAKIEHKVRLGRYGSAHVDLIINGDTLIELKTINGTGYRRMFGQYGEGARISAILQGCVSGYSYGPEIKRVIVAVFSLEVTTPDKRDAYAMPPTEWGRFAAQWTFEREAFEPLAIQEIARMEKIVDRTDAEGYEVIPRIIPDPWMPPHEIVSPGTSQYRERDRNGLAKKLVKTWHCDYCEFQSTCADRIIEEQLKESIRLRDAAVDATILNFPGAREATPEEQDALDEGRLADIPQKMEET